MTIYQRLQSKDFLIFSFLFLFPFVFFFELTFLKKIFYCGDISILMYPFRVYGFEQIKSGNLPLWTPDIFCGFPLLAGIEGGIFYPFNILFLFLPGTVAYNIVFILSFSLSGIFMFLYLREIKLSNFASFFSSFTWTFCGFRFVHFLHITLLDAIIWLPLILYFLEKGLKRNKIKYIFLIGIGIAFCIFAGHPPIFMRILFAILVYFGYKLFCYYKEYRNLKGFIFITSSFLSAIIIGICLSSIQLLPTYELSKLSQRGEGMDYISTTIPFIPSVKFATGFIWPITNDIYISISALLLAIISVIFLKDQFVKFLFGFSIFFIILYLGNLTPLYKIIYYLPGFNLIRRPDEWALIFVFSISVLAGFGIDFLTKNIIKNLSRKIIFLLLLIGAILISWLSIFLAKALNIWFSVFISIPFILLLFLNIFLITLFIKNKIETKKFKYLFIILTLITPFHHYLVEYLGKNKFKEIKPPQFVPINILGKVGDMGEVKTENHKFYEMERGFIKFLKEDKDLFRIINIGNLLGPLPGNINLLYEISSSLGYSNLILNRYMQILGSPNAILKYDMLNVKYFLTSPHIYLTDLELVWTSPEGNIYKNNKYLPRAFVVHKYKVVKNEKDIMNILSSDFFNPWEYIILEEKPDIFSQKLKPKSSIKITKYTPQEVIIKTKLNDNGFLVLSDSYYPGWSVSVNNKEGKIYKANYYIRAVPLKKGNHIVKFKYNPKCFKFGAIISITTIILTLLFALKTIRRKNEKYKN